MFARLFEYLCQQFRGFSAMGNDVPRTPSSARCGDVICALKISHCQCRRRRICTIGEYRRAFNELAQCGGDKRRGQAVKRIAGMGFVAHYISRQQSLSNCPKSDDLPFVTVPLVTDGVQVNRSEEHTSELQS